MEMENYCSEMFGIAACACLALQSRGEVFFAFSLNTELASGELGKGFVYLDSETWILSSLPAQAAALCLQQGEGLALGACKGCLGTAFCIKDAWERS